MSEGIQVSDIQKTVCYGRIKEYNSFNGYGFICTNIEKKEIFFSSYNVVGNKTNQSQLPVGAIVRFFMNSNEKGLYAEEICVIEKYPVGTYLLLPNHELLKIKRLYKIGIASGKRILNEKQITEVELALHGYSRKDFDYLFFSTAQGEYRFFNIGSKINGDGRCDIYKVYADYKKDLFDMTDIDVWIVSNDL